MKLTFPPITNSIDITSFGRWFRIVATPDLSTADAQNPGIMRRYAGLLKRKFDQAPGAQCAGLGLVFAPKNPKADIAVTFWTGSAFPPIPELFLLAAAKELVRRKLVAPSISGLIICETPDALVQVNYRRDKIVMPNRKTTCGPVFLDGAGLEIDCPALGNIRFDLVYSGGFHAIVSPKRPLLSQIERELSKLPTHSEHLYEAICQQFEIFHPGQPEIRGIEKIIWNLPNAPLMFDCTAGRPIVHPVCGNAMAALLLRNALLQKNKSFPMLPTGKNANATIEEYFVSYERPGAIISVKEADIG